MSAPDDASSVMLAHPPEAWLPARRLAAKMRAPIERFLHNSASSGMVLLATSIAALIVANSPLHHLYEEFLHYEVGFVWGHAEYKEDLHFWINEGLMTFFFLIVGLEVKREMVHGTLSNVRAASLPIAAAVGGMVAPALVYLTFNAEGGVVQGWAVPTATDIAFALGILALLGDRVPAPLRVFLLALAVVDDILAIVIIALFYSSGLSAAGVPLLLLGFFGLFVFHRLGVRAAFLTYVIPGILLWEGLHQCGLHPTLAGVIVGLSVPARPWYGTRGFLRVARAAIAEFEKLDDVRANEEVLLHPLAELGTAQQEAVSPVVRLTDQLHVPVAFGVVPLFAFANAGVALGDLDFGVPTALPVALGIVLGLVIGKPLGVVGAVVATTRLNLASLPVGVKLLDVLVAGLLAGIGFTMSIFIAELGFRAVPEDLPVAKLAILAGTLLAGALGLGLGYAMLKPPSPTADPALLSVEMAERSLS